MAVKPSSVHPWKVQATVKAPVKPAKKPTAAADEPAPVVKLPKTLGATVDLLYSTRNERLAINKVATKLETEEKFIKAYLIDELPKSESNGVAGKLARVSIEKGSVPQVEDWPLLYAHIVKTYNDHMKKKTGLQDSAFSLLNRALNGAAVEEQWDADKKVPGVRSFGIVKVSLNKI
jgi:hypothetical protein